MKVAAFAIQDTDSPQKKVWGGLVYRDPRTGSVVVTTAHGGYDQWTAGRMTTCPISGTGAVQSAAHMWQRREDKRAKGYDHSVTRTGLYDVPADTVSPKPLLAMLVAAEPVERSYDFPSLAQAAITAPADGPGSGRAAPAATRVHLDDEDHEPPHPTGTHPYLPRDLAGQPDYLVLRRLRGTLNVRLKGLPGGGKTTLPAAAFGDDLITVQGHDDLTVPHMVGSYLPETDGSFTWTDGPLTAAMRHGKVFLLDEATRAPTGTVNALLSVADHRGVLVLDDRPDLPPVHAADGFTMIITYNEEGVGVRPLDDAVKRRFPFELTVETDYDVAAQLGVDPRLTKVGRNLATTNAERGEYGIPLWRPQMAHLLDAQAILDAGLGDEMAAATLVSACDEPDDATIVRETVTRVFGIDAAPLTLGAMR
ncbi:MAG: AAA family ATPase [Tomitella sp.]|nr:AAA family ATPase [Tomitella sp.]